MKRDANDVVRICLHLKYALARILLTDTGYDETYDPFLRSEGIGHHDWQVTANSNRHVLRF